MSHPAGVPGPIADRTYDLGMKLGALAGIVGLGLSYLGGLLSLSNGVHLTLTLVLFPVYILTVAIVLGAWLGYGTDERNLEPVEEPVEMGSGEPWTDRPR